MNTSEIGKRAEELVAIYLEKKLGHRVLHKNWKNRYAEIDIISLLGSCVYFIEVKYRSSAAWGTGLDYITTKKLKQMEFAAELWLNSNKSYSSCQLLAAEVDSDGTINVVEL